MAERTPAVGQYYPVTPQVRRGLPTWLIVLVASAVGVLLLCGVGVLAYLANSSPANSGLGGAAPSAADLNQPTRDGKFEFTVTKIECGRTQVGSELFNKKAQGQFCLVHLSVRNIGNEARRFDAGNQKAFGGGNIEYSADGGAGLYLGDEGNAFHNTINPGNAVTGIIVFDIPKDAMIDLLVLHDSAFSGGATVAIS